MGDERCGKVCFEPSCMCLPFGLVDDVAVGLALDGWPSRWLFSTGQLHRLVDTGRRLLVLRKGSSRYCGIEIAG